MRVKDIVVGGVYHDGKMGVRKVLSIARDDAGMDRVRYSIMESKVRHSFDHRVGKMVSIIGNESSCHLTSFATWAWRQISTSEYKQIQVSLEAGRTKLTPGEQKFLLDLANPIYEGSRIQAPSTYKRTLSGLEKKGLLVLVEPSGEVEFTALGAYIAEQSHATQSTT